MSIHTISELAFHCAILLNSGRYYPIEIKIAVIMKKFLIFVLLVLSLFTTDIEVIKQPREQFLAQSIDFLSESTKVQRPSAATRARTRIDQQIELTEKQATHLDEQLSSEIALRKFFQQYCVEREMSLFFFTDKLENICDIIERSIQRTGI
ncbi:hypothetical protein PSECIP111951_03824 [Pseudoalteromonas holothuriae]|uniref:Orphan protein n=2 Tax=Pseudoalteromonas holothuriae TaxID=2963714 RepID=A0ABN8UR52_9GAMM|nr:hypothetical protein PSECIP111951_03824 [Pseudoalteromonas sp. CIP111951]